jgi:hypothetical protein
MSVDNTMENTHKNSGIVNKKERLFNSDYSYPSLSAGFSASGAKIGTGESYEVRGIFDFSTYQQP